MSHRVTLSHGMWQQECDQITYLDSFYGQIILQNTSVGISPVPIVPQQHIFLDTLSNSELDSIFLAGSYGAFWLVLLRYYAMQGDMLVLCAAIKVITGVQEHILASTSTDIFDTLQVTGYLNLLTALNILRIGVSAIIMIKFKRISYIFCNKSCMLIRMKYNSVIFLGQMMLLLCCW